MVLIKIRLLLFSVLSRYGLAHKYRVISQILIYNCLHNCNLRYRWYYIFIFSRSNYNLLGKVRWFVTWRVGSIIISSDNCLTQNIIWEQIKVGERKRWIKEEFWCIPDLMLHLDNGFYFQAIHGLLLLRNELITEKNI